MTGPIDILKIDTPENVTFSYEVAGIGSRFLAALVDTFLIVVLQVIIIGTLILIVTQLPNLGSDLTSGSDYRQIWWAVGILTLISFLFFWGYYIFFEILWNGQTPGKRWIGLRVIRLDGTPVTASEVIIRNLVRTLDALPSGYGVGVITMFINENSRRLGDLAAGTLVVRDRETTLSELPVSHPDKPAAAQPVSDPILNSFPLVKITDEDTQLIDSFLARRATLANRRQLALHILQSLCSRLGFAMDPAYEEDPERVLIAIRKARQG